MRAAQAGLLFFLGKRDGALIGEAAEAVDVAPSAMTGLVDRMVKAGLIERRPDQHDGRANRLFMTAKGLAARDHAKSGLDSINARMSEGLSPEDVAVIARWLTHLSERFPRDDGPDTP